MTALNADLRNQFEREVTKARDAAEMAAKAALATLAVEQDRPYDSMPEAQRELRRALRARSRQLGEGDMEAGLPLLVEEIAYEQWHHMLFARFLAENELLMHPQGVAVTLEECAELAQEEGAEDLWAVATRYASEMLPGIFRVDDPALQVRFAPEGRHRLEQIVSELPRSVFTSDDGLGWAYQFWQSKKKDEVNASERKIGGADIAPVTQLFTEDYMVKFLLHNTLGAWWAHRHPDSPLNKTFEYLRYRDDGTPAAGTFDGWPENVAEVTMMDPCGGSGHFIVAAFEMFTRMRMEEEGLSATEAGDVVIRDNVHMLEIDLRCTQIAAFNLSLTAWRCGGYRELPKPSIACSGIPVQGQLHDWTKLARGNEVLNWSLKRLYHLFRNAPDLGSLINPVNVPLGERMFIRDYKTIRVVLREALHGPNNGSDKTVLAYETAMVSVADAAELLSRDYLLVVTNVPYLAYGKHSDVIRTYLDEHFPVSKTDLATAFVERARDFCRGNGVYALVTPQNWNFQDHYKDFRSLMLNDQSFIGMAWLGSGAFEAIGGEVVKAALCLFQRSFPAEGSCFFGIDASLQKTVKEKSRLLELGELTWVEQSRTLSNPDKRIVLSGPVKGNLLGEYASYHNGIQSGDYARFGRFFWELPKVTTGWEYQQSTVRETANYSGREHVFFWEEGQGEFYNFVCERLGEQRASSWIRGADAWGKIGIAVSPTGKLKATLYTGELFDDNTVVLIPHKAEYLPALWAFCSSSEYHNAVRSIDQALKVRGPLVKVPFQIEFWNDRAKKLFPDGLPKSDISDSTQWLFSGRPEHSMHPLQVAVARLLGYQWPETVYESLERLADKDGIVCLPSMVDELPADERLRSVLSRAYSEDWSLSKQRLLLSESGFKGKDLAIWLRDGFYKQHCKLFKYRPFIWHIWDGRKDGFSALVNYHKLDHARLERLIYTYLGDWINTQRAEQEQGVAGADGRLVVALELKKKLELILEGEPPYDIYVRWKPLHEQPIGWNPDLNDGVRLNIRPFVKAGVLRSKFTIHWKKDRGKNPDGSERINDLHFTREEKLQARKEALGAA